MHVQCCICVCCVVLKSVSLFIFSNHTYWGAHTWNPYVTMFQRYPKITTDLAETDSEFMAGKWFTQV